MKKQIISIERANESTIMALIKLGILYIGNDNQIHVVEKMTKEN